MTAENRVDGPRLGGEIYVMLPVWNLEDWAYIEITARTSDPVRQIGLDLNYTEEDNLEDSIAPFYTEGDSVRLITDGTVQKYQLSLAKTEIERWNGPWTDLGIWFNSQDHVEEAILDILSIKIIPNEALYSDASIGVKTVERGIPQGTIIIDEFAPIYHSRKVGPACLCKCGDSNMPEP